MTQSNNWPKLIGNPANQLQVIDFFLVTNAATIGAKNQETVEAQVEKYAQNAAKSIARTIQNNILNGQLTSLETCFNILA